MIEEFLIKTLKRLRKDAPRRLKDLKLACDLLIEKAGTSEDALETQYLVDFFGVLSLSCESKVSRMIEIALDAWYFLIEHGLIKSSSFSSGDSAKKNDTEAAIESICKCSDEFDETVQLLVIKCLLTSITSLDCGVHGASLLLCIRACFHINLMSKNGVIKGTAKAALTQMINIINQRMEMHIDDKTSVVSTEHVELRNSFTVDPNEQDETDRFQNSQDFASLFHRDSYLVFRALCKLSMKGITEDQTQDSNVTIQNKILSLELLLNLLQNCGLTFRSNEKFIYAIRNYLCVSLLSNCTSQLTQVTGLSLQIFVLLLENFKQHLKSEVEVFLSTIFIRILESENSTYEHKLRVLEVFHNICKDPVSQIELFVNYDCDFEATNLFSRMVAALARMAKNPTMSNVSRVTVDFMAANARKLQLEELQLRTNGLEVLVAILRSLGASVNLQSSSSASKLVLDDLKSGKSVAETQKSLDHSLSSPSSNADEENLSLNIVETFDKKLKIQEEIEMGILRFNMSPMKGLKYLNSHGHLELTPKAVTEFLIQHQDKLDKTAVGDLLGREKEYESGFCYHVLGEYVDSMDFSRMAFDKAIRHFLNGFRLPGEAQKIDRIMEKFAERYYLQHKDQFASADMAFILAFSTIMLQTNLHNPAIKDDKRMTKEQFIKQNKGISADGELSDELLASIYDNIAAEPISFTSDVKKSKKDDNAFVVFQSLSDRKKKDAFSVERKEMVRVGEALIRQSKKRNSTFVTKVVTNDESYVKPMFELVWPPVVGVLSHLLESFDDAKIIELCTLAIQYAIGLSCRLDCAIARNTFVNALSKFTSLDTVKEMKHKNILCIKLILNIALTDGDYLDESWTQVLQCISMLSRLQTLTNNLQNDEIYLSEMNTLVGNDGSRHSKKNQKSYGDRYTQFNMNSSISDPFSKLFVGPSKAETNRMLEEANADLISKDIDPVLIDKIFLNSVNLSTQSVIHFVRSLCQVSMLEISTSNAGSIIRGRENFYDLHIPRTFSLQKIVEVADYNMNTRLRMEWTSIWKFLEEHFTSVGLHDNIALAMYAIDSLKQLSIKFLQKDELSNFNFQRLFLKPFESIIAETNSIEIRDLVLRCIDIMIKACATNIRSGWKTIFSIVGIAAVQSSAEVASIAFDIMERLMTDNFELLVNDFVELMNCLVSFVSSAHTQLSLRALPYMEVCSDYLARTTVTEKRVSEECDGLDLVEQEAVFRFWWPLFLGLSTRVSDVRAQVRIQSLEILRSILFKHGQIFSSQTWGVIFKGVLFPIIDSAKIDINQGNLSDKSTEKESWVGSMAYLVLRSYSDLYLCFRYKDNDLVLLSDILFLYENCVCNEVKLLSTTALQVLRQLIFSLGREDAVVEKTLDNRHINMIISILRNCVMRNLVFSYEGMGSLSVSQEKIPLEIQSVFSPQKSFGNSARVKTPYGTGAIVQENLNTLSIIDVGPRNVVQLLWGGKLFTCDNNLLSPSNVFDTTSNAPSPTCTNYTCAAIILMSTIVVELINIMSDFWQNYVACMEMENFKTILFTLEISHWHAVSFNENLSLRLRILQISDDKSCLPNLLEQEVLSMEKLLLMLFSLYGPGATNGQIDYELLQHWIQRLCLLMVQRFITLEESIYKEMSDNDSGDEYDDKDVLVNDNLMKARHHSYLSPIITLLENVLNLSSLRFQQNQHWIVPQLSSFIVCSNQRLRLSLQKIYVKHLDPFFTINSQNVK